MRDSMKNKLIMYLEDDNIHCFVKKENRLITYHLLPKTLKFGKIIHRPKFLREFKLFLKTFNCMNNMKLHGSSCTFGISFLYKLHNNWW